MIVVPNPTQEIVAICNTDAASVKEFVLKRMKNNRGEYNLNRGIVASDDCVIFYDRRNQMICKMNAFTDEVIWNSEAPLKKDFDDINMYVMNDGNIVAFFVHRISQRTYIMIVDKNDGKHILDRQEHGALYGYITSRGFMTAGVGIPYLCYNFEGSLVEKVGPPRKGEWYTTQTDQDIKYINVFDEQEMILWSRPYRSERYEDPKNNMFILFYKDKIEVVRITDGKTLLLEMTKNTGIFYFSTHCNTIWVEENANMFRRFRFKPAQQKTSLLTTIDPSELPYDGHCPPSVRTHASVKIIFFSIMFTHQGRFHRCIRTRGRNQSRNRWLDQLGE